MDPLGLRRVGATILVALAFSCTPRPIPTPTGSASPSAETVSAGAKDAASVSSAAMAFSSSTGSLGEVALPSEPSDAGVALSSDDAGASDAGASSANPTATPQNLTEHSIDLKYADGPLFFTPAFDGSQRFSLWLEVMRFARTEGKKRGKTPHFTFFVNACYYSTTPGHSEIGRAHTQAEVLVRRALTQQAINEGHDIGSHGVGHEDGRTWSVEAWRTELSKWSELMIPALFTPIPGEDGSFVFPRFDPAPGVTDGEVGARCAQASDCSSGQCIEVTAQDSFCTVKCNLKKPCPSGTTCGSPMFLTDTDVCLPTPKFPIEHQGQTLFFANGAPNFTHPALKPYHVEGFRVPFLASNDALYQVLLEQGYEYDTSLARSPKAPFGLSPPRESAALVEFPLMPHPGARTIPMDYNYRLLHATPERMLADYTSSLVNAQQMGHIPWNVGHHFATWDEGAFLEVLEETVRFTMDGCPDATTHETRCSGAEVVSFRDLLDVLKARGGVPPGWKGRTKRPPPK